MNILVEVNETEIGAPQKKLSKTRVICFRLRSIFCFKFVPKHIV